MPLTITLGALTNAEPALNELAKAKRPAKGRYHLGRLLILVRIELLHFQTEREALIKELGEERDPTPLEVKAGQMGKLTAITPANIPEFIKRLNELAAVEVTLDDKWLLTQELLTDDLLSVDDEIALGTLLIASPEPKEEPPA